LETERNRREVNEGKLKKMEENCAESLGTIKELEEKISEIEKNHEKELVLVEGEAGD
jgi:hypothetical protein